MGRIQTPPSVKPGGSLEEPKRSALLMVNTTEMGTMIERLGCKFDLLYSKRAFVHWFLKEGMEETEFTIAREDVAAVVLALGRAAQLLGLCQIEFVYSLSPLLPCLVWFLETMFPFERLGTRREKNFRVKFEVAVNDFCVVCSKIKQVSGQATG